MRIDVDRYATLIMMQRISTATVIKPATSCVAYNSDSDNNEKEQNMFTL